MSSHKNLIRTLYVFVLLLCVLATVALGILLESKQFVFKQAVEEVEVEEVAEPFPVSVDPATETIVESTAFDQPGNDDLAISEDGASRWWRRIVAVFSSHTWYQNLASPVGRIIVIWPGERKEELTKSIGDVLGWNITEREKFVSLITTTEPVLSDGTFFPGQYLAHKDARPDEIALLIQDQFKTDVLDRYTPEVQAKVPLQDALIIASLLEREASDFENMREVSGVIWNRLFIDMPLQLDATLQYVRGSRPNEDKWWPAPRPKDKFLNSPYNTYSNKGLPPSPISNPSAEAVLAALNPRSTDCLYYFHDSKQGYHCSLTYEEHVAKLKTAYGRGQ